MVILTLCRRRRKIARWGRVVYQEKIGILRMISGEIGHIQGSVAGDMRIENDIKKKFLLGGSFGNCTIMPNNFYYYCYISK